VTESGLSGLDIHSLTDHQRRVGAAQVVEAEVRYSDLQAGRLPNPLAKGRVLERSASRTYEHVRIRVGRCNSPPLQMGSEQLHEGTRDAQGSSAAV
jgi:hypothetical protein